MMHAEPVIVKRYLRHKNDIDLERTCRSPISTLAGRLANVIRRDASPNIDT